VRDLEGALIRVLAHAKLTNSEITVYLAEKTLHDIIGEHVAREVSVELIQEIVAIHYKITVEQIRSKTRTANISFARQVAMYLSRKLLDIPLAKVGEEFGGRDHTTIIHACNKIADEIENNDEFKKTLLILEDRIK